MPEFFLKEQTLHTMTQTIIKNKAGKSLFLLVGRWGAHEDVLSLYTMTGELVASVKQTSFIFGTCFELYQEFNKIGIMQQIMSIHAHFYYVKQLHWFVLGDIYNHRYIISKINRTVMEMDKTTVITGDYFHLMITEEQDVPACICIAAILDYWLYNRKKANNIKWRLSLTTI